MMAPQHPVPLLLPPDQLPSHQRHPPHIESLHLLLPQILFQPPALLLLAPLAPVFFLHPHLHSLLHHLHPALHPFPFIPAPQSLMPIHHPLPRPLHLLTSYLSRQLTPHLLHIQSRLRLVQRMEQHPFLHRRQRVDLLHLPSSSHDPSHLLLHQLLQLRPEHPHTFPHLLFPVHLPAVVPHHPQPSSLHYPADLQQVRPLALRAPLSSHSLSRHPQQPLFSHHLIHLPQVVEYHLRLPRSPQLLLQLLIPAHVPQQPVSHSSPRHSTQLFLHPPQRFYPTHTSPHLQPYRI